MKGRAFEKATPQLTSLAALTLLLFNTGCGAVVGVAADMAVAAIGDAVLGGETATPLGNNKYQISYDGYGADKRWITAVQKTCNGKEFDIISSNAISRPDGLPGFTGIVQCKGGPTSVKFVSRIDSEEKVRAALDNGGPPFDEWVYSDNNPVSKILFYKREPFVNPILFTYDSTREKFIYQAVSQWNKEKFDEIKGTDNYKKAAKQWYSSEVANLIVKNHDNIDLEFKYIKELEAVSPKSARAYNALAWFYATSPETKYRNSDKAIKYGELAISSENNWQIRDTLAAAYASGGNFEKAAEIEAQVALECPSDEKEKFVKLAEAYRNKKTYTEYKMTNTPQK